MYAVYERISEDFWDTAAALDHPALVSLRAAANVRCQLDSSKGDGREGMGALEHQQLLGMSVFGRNNGGRLGRERARKRQGFQLSRAGLEGVGGRTELEDW